MALTSGTKLGPYEIQSPVGAGGMGEVYRARDTRLGRTVAIKVLPENFSFDANLRERLEREARSVSKLSHPHICTLHDIGHQDGIDFLVMEYLEGETLEHRLLRGPLPSNQTLRYGPEIADALAAAHKIGLVHRDLKPSNVMLTRSGAKLMDFGLAKQAQPAFAAAVTEGTKDDAKLTERGILVGTVQYMAPEQLEGKEANACSDIFALGEIIYEMATGKPAFAGGSRASLIAAILTRDPVPMVQLQPMTPAALDRVVKKCLAKDPEERWQSASDLASELRWVAESRSQSPATLTEPAGVLDRLRRRRLVAWTLVTLLLIAIFGVTWRQVSTTNSNPPRVAHLTLALPTRVSFGTPAWPLVALSRDGTKVVFSGTQNGVMQLYVRQMDQWDAVPIRGTEGGERPFLSPDGQWVAFTSGRTLKKVAIGGGPTIDLAETDWGGGSWGADDQIVYTRSYNTGLWRVAASGGSPQMLTSPDHSQGELAHWWPQILPDGDTVLFTSFSTPIERSRVVVRSLKTGKQKTLVEGGTFGRYLAPGYLMFSRGETVIAAPFDAGKLELTGAPVPVLEGIGWFPQNGVSQFAVSQNGTLAFLPSSFITTEQKLVSVDRKGKVKIIRDNLHIHGGMRLSPDGKSIALGLDEPGHPPDVWIQDLTRGLLSRLTHGPASNFNPIWTPDGKHILYTSERPVFEIYRKSADGSGTEEPVLTTANDKFPLSISSDGKTLLFSTSSNVTQQDLWIAALAQPQNAKPFVASSFAEPAGAISPDGRWVGYQSNESGQSEIYVIGFPNPENRVQVSTNGGSEPVWSRNGKELFYRSGNKLIEAPVEKGNNFATGAAHVILESAFAPNTESGIPAYDVSPDAQTFYFVQEDSKSNRESKVNLVLNWPEELKRLAPAHTGR
ncbi:MAG TPA: protein kinase [Candidatus Sulfotelmatobacter sp.]|nr:protein kinase [Candidatus Sulfotelmatobacter sp.]